MLIMIHSSIIMISLMNLLLLNLIDFLQILEVKVFEVIDSTCLKFQFIIRKLCNKSYLSYFYYYYLLNYITCVVKFKMLFVHTLLTFDILKLLRVT